MSESSAGISVIIPVFNERESLRPFYRELSEVLGKERLWELVAVDDASTDGSSEILRSIAQEDSRVRTVKLPQHDGKSGALSAGIEQAKYSVVVMIDCDLQYDPADIAVLLSALTERVGLVIGARRHRADSSWRKLQSRIYNWLMNRMFKLSLFDSNSGLKVCRREVFEHKLRTGEHRMLPVLTKRLGLEIVELPVSHRQRTYGHSKYGLGRSIQFLVTALTMRAADQSRVLLTSPVVLLQ